MLLDIPCVIFAGGKSSRMGEDKALLPFGNFKTLTQYQLTRLQKIFNKVYISTNSISKFDFNASFIEDVDTNVSAPTVGFVSVFEQLKCERFFVISVDTPFVDKGIITTILQADKPNKDATIALLNGKIQPLCGIYHNSLHIEFKAMLQTNQHKMGKLLKNKNVEFVNFECNDKFLNMNYKEEYENAFIEIMTK